MGSILGKMSAMVQYLFTDEPRRPELSPPLKWAGGKRWLVPDLRPLWQAHDHRRLVEPFAGGLAVTLGLRPERALLNDVNPHLINLYRWLRRGMMVEIPLENTSETFYSHRERFNKLIQLHQEETKEAAELFYYLNRTCFNGLCRFNSKGEFNVPFGKYTNIGYVRDFWDYARLLSAWDFSLGDFSRLDVEQSDFIYADPPYDVEFTTYSAGGFSWDDQVRLVEWLSSHPGPVVASNQATPRILELYKKHGFTLKTVQAPRRISCTGDRTPALEMIAYKNLD